MSSPNNSGELAMVYIVADMIKYTENEIAAGIQYSDGVKAFEKTFCQFLSDNNKNKSNDTRLRIKHTKAMGATSFWNIIIENIAEHATERQRSFIVSTTVREKIYIFVGSFLMS